MPIYEFYCPDCNMLFSFLSRRVDTTKRPPCPRCKRRKLDREVSMFAAPKGAKEGGEAGESPMDDARMESAMNALAADAEGIDENDPRQAAQLMRKFSDMTGMRMGKGIEEAMGRMEAGEDPEAVEAEMGDAIEADEEPFAMPGESKPGRGRGKTVRTPLRRDGTLYEM